MSDQICPTCEQSTDGEAQAQEKERTQERFRHYRRALYLACHNEKKIVQRYLELAGEELWGSDENEQDETIQEDNNLPSSLDQKELPFLR